jgi:penicillin-binding protein 1C
MIVATADLPPPLRDFGAPAGRGRQRSSPAVRIAFPPDGSRVAFAQTAAGLSETIAMKAEGGALPLTWFVNGAPLARKSRERTLFWKPDGEGFVHLTIVDGQGLSDSVVFRLETEARAAPSRRLLATQGLRE